MRKQDARSGFTLVELLVVIAIIGVLVALLLPAIQAAREAARRSSCSNNLHQIGIGLQNYVSTFRVFPAGQQQFSYVGYTWAWSAMCLEYFEEKAIQDLIQFEYGPLAPQNKDVAAMKVGIYICPSTSFRDPYRTPEDTITDIDRDGMWDRGEGMALLDYAGIAGPHRSARNPVTGDYYKENMGVLLSIGPLIVPDRPQILGAPRIRPGQITDGLSQTMVIGESTGRAWDRNRNVPDGAWAYGTNVITIRWGINRHNNTNGDPDAWTRPDQLYSDHPGGVHLLFADASVHFVSEDTPVSLLQSLASRNGEEIVPTELLK
ncbi:MAG: DUF1559 domain-containing protein [Planctomycetota bacterium]|nr:MAG: DUF1559 domain-containing protein [Planctomycetota bacterium]